MWASIFRAIGRALRGAAKYGFMLAEDVVRFPFWLFGLGGFHPAAQERAAESDSLQKANKLAAQNAALEKELSAPERMAPPLDRTPVVQLDTLDKRVARVSRFPGALENGRRTPDLAGLDMRTRLWCEGVRTDYAAAKAVYNVTQDGLPRHIGGVKPVPGLHAWPEDELVAEVARGYRKGMEQFADEPEDEVVRKFG